MAGRTRHNRAPRDIKPDDDDVDMGDVTKATLPEGVPQNPDGSVSTEAEIPDFQMKEIGSATISSAAKNKANAKKMRDKALGRNVRWNSPDAIELFDIIKSTFASEWGSIIVTVTREDPGPITQYPPVQAATMKDPLQLYAYVENCHGSFGPATYKVTFRMGSMERGHAPLHMPDKTAPPLVQVFSPQPQPQQPPQQYAPPPYPPPYGGGGSGWGGGSPPGGGYWPPQQQPQQPQAQREIFVIAPPGAPQQAPQAAAPAAPQPPPQPQYMPAPLPAAPSVSPEVQRLIEQMGLQQAAMMSVLKEIVESSKKPVGFIALPEGYPIAPGYVPVPGGMIPNPMGVTGVGQLPPQSQPAPVQPVVVAAAPVAAPVVVREPAPPLTPDQQISGAVKMMSTFMRGMEEMQGLVNNFGRPAGSAASVLEPEDPEPEAPPPAPNPVTTTQIGDLSMVFNAKDGTTNWAATIMGALPKFVNMAKDGLHEYQKVVERQATLTTQAVEKRIQLAHAVQGATRAMQGTPALPSQPPPAPPAPPHAQPQIAVRPGPLPPQQQPAPAQHAPAPPAPVRRPTPKVPVPAGPIWS